MESNYSPQTSQSSSRDRASASVSAVSQGLLQLGNALVRFLAPDDLITVRRGDRNGQSIWFVYDRYSDQHLEFTSEDIRDWLGA
jgi:hypothetical protein